MDRPEIGRMTRRSLLELAKEEGIRVTTKMRKNDLLKRIAGALDHLADLRGNTREWLGDRAKELGVPVAGRMRKQELVDEISAVEGPPGLRSPLHTKRREPVKSTQSDPKAKAKGQRPLADVDSHAMKGSTPDASVEGTGAMAPGGPSGGAAPKPGDSSRKAGTDAVDKAPDAGTPVDAGARDGVALATGDVKEQGAAVAECGPVTGRVGDTDKDAAPDAGDEDEQAGRHPWLTGAELPERYGDHRVVLMPRSPHWLFCYWDISEQKLQEDGIDPAELEGALELFILRDGRWELLEQTPVELASRRYYLQVEQDGARYRVVLLLKRGGGEPEEIPSGETEVPPAGPGSDDEPRFMTVPWDSPLVVDGPGEGGPIGPSEGDRGSSAWVRRTAETHGREVFGVEGIPGMEDASPAEVGERLTALRDGLPAGPLPGAVGASMQPAPPAAAEEDRGTLPQSYSSWFRPNPLGPSGPGL